MTDRKIVLMVTGALALLALAALAGIVVLAVLENPIPDVLQNVAIGSMSALAALLASTKSADVPQQVVGPAGGPVPVDAVPEEFEAVGPTRKKPAR